MQTNIHEIADGVYRLSTCVPEVAPGGFTFNQYLIDADEPFLFHTGPRQMFDLVAPAAAQVIDIERLRWISFGHVESDECGAMNRWLEAAPHAAVTFNGLGCDVSLNDLADRPPVVASDDRAARHRRPPDPHDPDPARAPRLGGAGGVRRDHRHPLLRRPLHPGRRRTGARARRRPPRSRPRRRGHVPRHEPHRPTRRPRCAGWPPSKPRTLALMHGPAFVGDCSAALLELADAYEARFRAACGAGGRQHDAPPATHDEGGADDRPPTIDRDVRPIERPEATKLAEDEVARMVAALRSLDAGGLDPTDRLPRSGTCEPWPATCSA